MVVPWIGFPLGDLLKRFKPTSKAKFVEFKTLYDPKQMPGQRSSVLEWPYVEGLRMDEAMHPLTLMAVGLYGKVLPNQNGAPMRLIVPWKYGFKGIKAIVAIKFTDRMPRTTWARRGTGEYGFFANVNPAVDHPRWSQASERHIGSGSLFELAPPDAAVQRLRRPSGEALQRHGSQEIFLSPADSPDREAAGVRCVSAAGPAVSPPAPSASAGLSLGADPVAMMLHTCGRWTLNFLLITLCMTPLRDFTRSVLWLRFRRMFGLFAFFYVLLHFSRVPAARSGRQAARLWQDIVKRPYITLGMLGLVLLDPARAHLDRQGAAPAGKALDPTAPPGLRRRAARRLAFLVAGQEGHPPAAALCLRPRAAARLPPVEGRHRSALRFSVARFARTDGVSAAAPRCSANPCTDR